MSRASAPTAREIHFDLLMAAAYIGFGFGVLVKYATKHYGDVWLKEQTKPAPIPRGGSLINETALRAYNEGVKHARECPDCNPALRPAHVDPSEQQL